MAGRIGRRLLDFSGFSGDSPASYRGRMWKAVNPGKNANRKAADASGRNAFRGIPEAGSV